MEEEQVVPGTSWQALKERFLRNIVPDLEFFDMSAEEEEQLKLGGSTLTSLAPTHAMAITPLPRSSVPPTSIRGVTPLSGSAARSVPPSCLLGPTPSSRFVPTIPSPDIHCIPRGDGDLSLSPMERIRNETVRSLKSGMLELCEAMGDTQDEINATGRIIDSRIISSSPARRTAAPTRPNPSPEDQPASPSAATLSHHSETESCSEQPLMVCASTQTGSQRFSCDICGFGARDGCNLSQHMTSMHMPRYQG